MSVCFSGYRPEKLPWGGDESDPRCTVLKKRLYDAAESACAEGYRHFICGMARGVDLYACEAVLQLREKYRDVRIEGGCNGNLQGISHLVIGMKAQDAIDRMRGIRCGGKPSSCPDQLATALTQALEQAAQQGA